MINANYCKINHLLRSERVGILAYMGKVCVTRSAHVWKQNWTCYMKKNQSFQVDESVSAFQLSFYSVFILSVFRLPDVQYLFRLLVSSSLHLGFLRLNFIGTGISPPLSWGLGPCAKAKLHKVRNPWNYLPAGGGLLTGVWEGHRRTL